MHACALLVNIDKNLAHFYASAGSCMNKWLNATRVERGKAHPFKANMFDLFNFVLGRNG